MPYVNERWLGGLLTNFVTVRKSLDRLKELELMSSRRPAASASPRRSWPRLEKERVKLEKNLQGIKGMKTVPDAVFVIDTRKEAIAVQEARKLKIPVVGIVDTNCDPDEVDYVIPGNDDALRAIQLFAGRIADAVLAGRGPARGARRRRRGAPTRAPARERKGPSRAAPKTRPLASARRSPPVPAPTA